MSTILPSISRRTRRVGKGRTRPVCQRSHRTDVLRAYRGFTLVEMLVAVTLVLLMMSMFARVFQMAGSSISQMRGMAENDQRARMLQTIIKADFDKRTFRWVYPFAANEDPDAPESNISSRQGFFYISENNPLNSLDDVLHFTTRSTVTTFNQDTTPYYGLALTIFDPTTSPAVQSPFVNIPDQPDADDANLLPNSTGQSTAAEVCYFVRNGNLYRRQLLIREPLTVVQSRTQPDDNSAARNNLFNPAYTTVPGYPAQYASGNGLGTFYGDFDYSAYFDMNGAAPTGAKFLGDDALNNGIVKGIGLVPSSPPTPIRISNPALRFGFSPFVLLLPSGSQQLAGRPKEFTGDGSLTFIGRFTMQETSSVSFQYPQGLTTSGSIPTHPTAYNIGLDPSGSVTTSPDNLSTGLRRGEDLLLPNVHSFDIQVYDQGFGGFFNIGDDPGNITSADYRLANRNGGVSASYGPRVNESLGIGVINAVYDTWHPQIPIDYDGDGNPFETPPYRPLINRPGTLGNWAPSISATFQQTIFPTIANTPNGTPFFYRCISAGKTGTVEPPWPRSDGMTIQEQVAGGGGAIWECVENRKPLKAIKITIRYVDISTQQMRQLTIVQSLVD